jgi:SulP family sulfate permease
MEIFFELPEIAGEHFHTKMLHLVAAFSQFYLTTSLLSLLALFLVIFSPKVPGLKRLPGALTALVIATIIQVVFQFDGISAIGSALGGIPQDLPEFSLPSVT